MKLKMRLLCLSLVLVFAMTTLLGCASKDKGAASNTTTEKTYTLKLAHEESPGADQDIYSKMFKKIVEAKTNGQVTVNIYTLGQLGDGANQVELLQNGAIELGTVSTGPAGVLVPESNIFSLHYLLPTDPVGLQDFLHNSDGMKMMNDLFYAKNMKVLDWAHEGFFYWTANKPLRTPADFKGFKMRTMAAPLIAASYNAYGANATPVPYAEVYSGLQLKMIDGQTNPIPAIRDMKYYEVQKYLMDAGSDSFMYAICASKPFWESIPVELQNTILDSAKEANTEYNKNMLETRQTILDEITSKGMTLIQLTDEEKAAFRELSVSVRKQYVEASGGKSQELLDLFQKDAEKYNK